MIALTAVPVAFLACICRCARRQQRLYLHVKREHATRRPRSTEGFHSADRFRTKPLQSISAIFSRENALPRFGSGLGLVEEIEEERPKT